MGGKKKGGKKGKKGKKAAEDEDPMDELHALDGETLEKLRSTNREKLVDAKLYRNLLQMEKDMIHDFYHNTRAEIRELEARVKNFDTDMQTKEEGHRTELKVFMQKVRHLEYDHGNSQEQVKANADTIMLEEQKQHTERELEMMKMKKKEKDDYFKSEQQAHNEIDISKKEGEQQLTAKQKALDTLREQLIDQYDQQLDQLRRELDLRMKVEVHEIEERKNQHINDLMKAHEAAFQEMKEYYNDITRENLELIRTHRVRLTEIGEQIEQNVLHAELLVKQREEFDKPKREIEEKLNTLQRQLQTYGKDQMGLRNAKARLAVLKQKEKQVKQDRADLEEKFQRVEKEKNDMYGKFELAVEQLRSKANVKNQVLDQVLAVRQAELERKNVQLRELVQRSGLDQDTVDEICKKMEEAIEAKNSIIRNLRYSMAHATKAYNDAIRVYEAKLVEFGIPAEELGLELLETQTSDMPAGLVAA